MEHASLGCFDFAGEVEVSVTSNGGDIQTGRVRSLSYGITPQIIGNMRTSKLDHSRNLSVKMNGDNFHNLHLFVNPIDEDRPKKLKGKNLIYFAPRVHQWPGKTLDIPSGKTAW